MDDNVDRDHMRVPVPDHAVVSGYKIAIVIFGIGMTLPVFVVGAETAVTIGLWPAIWVFTGSCLVLAFLLGVTSVIGSRTRLSTYVIMEFAFGRVGARLINVLLALVLLAWFSFTADILGVGIRTALDDLYNLQLPRVAYTVIGSVLMTLTAIFGSNPFDGVHTYSGLVNRFGRRRCMHGGGRRRTGRSLYVVRTHSRLGDDANCRHIHC